MATGQIKAADRQAAQDAKDAQRWQKELQAADKREKEWRKNGQDIVDRYSGKQTKRNRYNVLWSNTEILRPAIYNTTPNPDVRRRFRDADPLGKAVSEVLDRALCVVRDDSSTETSLRNDVLDTLLCGRGISRVKYVPSFTQLPQVEASEPTEDEPAEAIEELENEQCCIEHIDWRDFRHGYGRTWDEVPWSAFRHKLTRPDAEKQFGKENLADIVFTEPLSDERDRKQEQVDELSKIAEFWEIWDKQGGKVLFIQENAKQLLYPLANPDGSPPIQFDGFFPHPEPLRIIETTGTLLPVAHFELYKEQANELDKLSARIDKIVDKLRLRGVYDAKLKELSDLMSADDNELIPVQNTGQWADTGIDKAISWMPAEQAVAVLVALNEAREKQKVIIDELTGISDIIRGVTDANETYGAQQLKSQYASVRLQRMQKEVQRYARDIFRLVAQLIASKFGTDTLAKMTDLKFPTAQEKQAMQAQLQLAMMQPQQGQQPQQPPINPALLQIPTWEDIQGLLQSPMLRQYRIDIETDSTIAGTLDSDAAGLTEVMKGVTEMLTGMGPIVQSGALPVDAAKELVMAVIRRARMGMAVEDAFEKMKAPNPTPPPPDHSIEVAQIRAQSDEKIAGMKLSAESQNSVIEHQAIAQTESSKQQLEAQRHNLELQTKAQLDMVEKEHSAQLEQLKMESAERLKQAELENQRMIADANNQTQLMIAEMSAQQKAQMAAQQQQHDLQMAQVSGQQQSDQQDKQLKHEKSQVEAPTVAAYNQVESNIAPLMQELIQHLNKPRRVVRDENGKMVGLQ